MLKLLALFTLVPAVELFLLLQIGSWLGPTPTFLVILLTGLAGATLAKREGLGVLRRLQGELARGLPPADRLMEGALVVMGGLLLITPGVLTDLTGFLLILPPSRRWLAPRALRWLARRFELRTFGPEVPFPDDDLPGDEEPRVRYRERRRGSDDGAGPHPFSNPFDDLP